MNKNQLQIIAGPCSVDERNLAQIYEILTIKEIYGTRVVGLKSRTALDVSGKGMGMDYQGIIDGIQDEHRQIVLPSIEIAKAIHRDTKAMIATEIMIPHLQMKLFEEAGIANGKLLAWNPAVNQLGWQVLETSIIAQKHHWVVGLKNPKWLGEELSIAENENHTGRSSMQKQWLGQVMYAQAASEIVLIHRGVDVPGKGDFRNALVHNQAINTKSMAKQLLPNTKIKLFFDPSHTYGPKLRSQIPAAIVAAMKMKSIDSEEYVYDGLLVEVGDSQTDTEQHITIAELQQVVAKIGEFRDFMLR